MFGNGARMIDQTPTSLAHDGQMLPLVLMCRPGLALYLSRVRSIEVLDRMRLRASTPPARQVVPSSAAKVPSAYAPAMPPPKMEDNTSSCGGNPGNHRPSENEYNAPKMK